MIISAGTACISQKKEQSVGAGFVHGSFELRSDKEDFRKYLRMNTYTFQVRTVLLKVGTS